MTQADFLREFAELLGEPAAEVQLETDLTSLAGWDSMGQLSTLSVLDELGAPPPRGALQQCRKVRDVVALAESRLTP